ncbi:MAG: FAD:protein transferase [Candidatus Saccharibacteria bacterium]|nr:FAD:protein transferase [Candidatus Saccharibacteria bacterium]
MKQTRDIMGMPVTVEINDAHAKPAAFQAVFDYFSRVDQRYSTYKPSSEISQINAGLPRAKWSQEMKQIMKLCQQTKHDTNGYFDIEHNGQLDPSGLVKGWAIQNAADLLADKGYKHYYVDVAGDVQVSRSNTGNKPWRIGIRNPLNRDEIIKVLNVRSQGVATSGTAIRGNHIYNPLSRAEPAKELISLTVIGPDIYNADRFATAAFAMGTRGIHFLEKLKGYEAYAIDPAGIATMTTGFESYVTS